MPWYRKSIWYGTYCCRPATAYRAVRGTVFSTEIEKPESPLKALATAVTIAGGGVPGPPMMLAARDASRAAVQEMAAATAEREAATADFAADAEYGAEGMDYGYEDESSVEMEMADGAADFDSDSGAPNARPALPPVASNRARPPVERPSSGRNQFGGGMGGMGNRAGQGQAGMGMAGGGGYGSAYGEGESGGYGDQGGYGGYGMSESTRQDTARPHRGHSTPEQRRNGNRSPKRRNGRTPGRWCPALRTTGTVHGSDPQWTSAIGAGRTTKFPLPDPFAQAAQPPPVTQSLDKYWACRAYADWRSKSIDRATR